jgi:hypothetical protein
MNENLIQVLWVEDDPNITRTYPLEAAQYGLQLVPFSCWEDAEKALVSEFERWSAIVLDAKCKYKHDSFDNAAVFLTQAIHSIDTICAGRHRILPWYVLSGGSEDELNDLIIDSREEWDGDWKDKKYYSKTTDRELLFHRIPYHAKLSPEMQIRLVYYPDVFKAIRRARLDSDVEVYMEDLLLPIHTLYRSGKDYNDNMTKVRKCIELIFQSMAQHGILPNQKRGGGYVMHDKLIDKRGGINNTWCSKIIAGQDAKNNERIIVKCQQNILPNVLKDSFHRLIEISAAYEHSENKDANQEQQANSRHTASFLSMINDAPYLLRGMAMELCDIILWYSAYLEGHGDEEINALNWDVVDNTKVG